MIQHIMFDFDGTLADTSEGIIKSMHYAFDKLDIPRVDDNTVANMIGPPLEEMFSKLLDTNDKEYIKQGVVYFRERYSVQGVRELKLYPGVEDTLKKLNTSGKKLYIVTSKPEVFVKKICEEYGILDMFTDITGVSTRMTSLSKGKRMKILMEKFNITPDNAVMVGDRPEDVNASFENQVRCIGMLYGFSNEQDLMQAGCIGIGRNIEQIIEFIY